MNEPNRPDAPKDSGMPFRDVAMIVLVGAALGLTHNWFMLQAGPGKGLAWIKTERKVVRLEDVAPDAGATPLATSPPAATPATPAPATPATSAPTAPARGAGDGKPAVPPAPKPATTPASGAAPAPAASAPAPAAPAADVPNIPESRDPIETGLAVVRKLYAANAAVFVDARSAGEYAESHIAGALNVPFDEVFKHPELVKKVDDRGLPIVCYCGGGDCDLSRNLAFSFLDAGKKRVVVFLDGLPAWKEAGLPVKSGDQP